MPKSLDFNEACQLWGKLEYAIRVEEWLHKQGRGQKTDKALEAAKALVSSIQCWTYENMTAIKERKI